MASLTSIKVEFSIKHEDFCGFSQSRSRDKLASACFLCLLSFLKEKTRAYESTFLFVCVCLPPPALEILNQLVDIYKIQ
jgi:hypothetical protein